MRQRKLPLPASLGSQASIVVLLSMDCVLQLLDARHTASSAARQNAEARAQKTCADRLRPPFLHHFRGPDAGLWPIGPSWLLTPVRPDEKSELPVLYEELTFISWRELFIFPALNRFVNNLLCLFTVTPTFHDSATRFFEVFVVSKVMLDLLD